MRRRRGKGGPLSPPVVMPYFPANPDDRVRMAWRFASDRKVEAAIRDSRERGDTARVKMLERLLAARRRDRELSCPESVDIPAEVV